jgi:type IV pilus assembly protein PilQ
MDRSVPLVSRRLVVSLLTALCGTAPTVLWLATASGAVGLDPLAVAQASPAGSIGLTLRRSVDSVDVVIQGVGASPLLNQRLTASGWLGQLQTSRPVTLRFGPQRMALPEAGLQSVSLEGSGSSFQLEVVPMAGATAARPVVSADGQNLVLSFSAPAQQKASTASADRRLPGTVPQAVFAPPLQPRAVAPPLGDMAVGSMVLRNQSFVDVSGPNVTLTLRNAPAKDALMAIAQLGGYGFVYVDEGAPTAAAPAATAGAGNAGAAAGATAVVERPVTIAFRNESYAKALNSVLLSAGLQGKRDGNMIMAGPNVLAKSFGAQLSKVYRLNQTSASSAADYLASLGAAITKVTVITNAVTQGTTQAQAVQGGPTAQQTQTQRITTTETYGGGVGPLKGLIGTTDSRLQTITLIGDSQLVAVAENYLRQIDLRQRQVALSVKILDVTLDNDAAISNSFAFRYGNNFIVSDQGRLVGAFGGLLPPGSGAFDVLSGGASSAKPTYGDAGDSPVPINPLSPAPVNPGRAYGADNFYDLVRAVITSASTKTLASPTLFLSDNPEQNARAGSGAAAAAAGQAGGQNSFSISSVTTPSSPVGRDFANEAFVVVGAQEITSYTVNQGSNGAPNTCQPVFQTAGLTLGARVKRIDDNGFVTFNLSPSITALTGTSVKVEGCGDVKTIAVRALDTGDVRVRDGQTLILTGVISDQDIQAVRKWPILGDIPFVGQFFRDSSNGRKKRELVILVTPRIVNDVQGGAYGYGYRPETDDARRLLQGGV